MQQAGFSPIAATCEAVSITNRKNIVVAFQNEAPPKVSTYESKFYSQKGFYRTLAACRRNLGNERRDFAKYTGLEPIYSQCALEAAYDRYPYYVHLVGFGKPKKLPLRRKWFSGIPVVANYNHFVASIEQQLASYGATLTHLAFRSELLAGGATIQFYADPDIGQFRTAAGYLAEVAGRDHCLQTVKTLQVQLSMDNQPIQITGRSFKPIAAYCQGSTFRGFYDINLAYLRDRRIKTHYSARTFRDSRSCASAHQTEAELAQAINPGMVVTATVCGGRPYTDEAEKGIFRVAVLLTGTRLVTADQSNTSDQSNTRKQDN